MERGSCWRQCQISTSLTSFRILLEGSFEDKEDYLPGPPTLDLLCSRLSAARSMQVYPSNVCDFNLNFILWFYLPLPLLKIKQKIPLRNGLADWPLWTLPKDCIIMCIKFFSILIYSVILYINIMFCGMCACMCVCMHVCVCEIVLGLWLKIYPILQGYSLPYWWLYLLLLPVFAGAFSQPLCP